MSSAETRPPVRHRHPPLMLQMQLLHEKPLPVADSVVDLRKVASCGSAEDLLRIKRRVLFADEMGLELVQVRVMQEPSWIPPQLQLPPSVLASLQSADSAASSDDESSEHHQHQHHHAPPVRCKFRCRFEQPNAKYILFREHLEKQCVCLSSLHFDGCTVKGAIGVKNICFNKRVFARVTFNGWKTSQDVPAAYSDSADGCGQDNFSFCLHCPAMTPFELCVCFEALDDGQAYWDSNGGENYKVEVVRKTPKHKNSPTSAANHLVSQRANFTLTFRPSFDRVTEFSEYSAWEHHGSDKVYY